ncbi:Tat pathway signal sequence domain protein [Myceligenerans pegani]|uniref:Tat pathway signal sequence domain protein n=1 Tax=Myceligenerans pegani TaxID=2776917 RepID=A0ABR9N6T1_9MICO|nr:Tat pathway signal sequence domain protein [Myceligenerans sp. TRM 65318]MBE1878752.1 Tat pathway signal sequence domain protein [Myceligenerans sp. TRM 65318]MBE3021023.1 Tat pathway signal sequence domain protein [Myceligenerans sp. TRM 65318]
MANVSRRTVLGSALAAGAAAVVGPEIATAAPAGPSVPLTGHDPIEVRWLDRAAPAALAAGVTWGVPWPRGALPGDQRFALTTDSGTAVPVQTWPTAWWPDGTVKWTAHAVGGDVPQADAFRLAPGSPATGTHRITVRERPGLVTVDTGVIQVAFGGHGNKVVRSVRRGHQIIAHSGRLVASRQDRPDTDGTSPARHESFTGSVDRVEVEQDGPVRAVIKVTGKHRHGNREWLPFVLRFSLFAGSDGIRLVHTFFWDGDEDRDFLTGLGVRFTVPMRGELYDRHIRLGDSGGGVLSEAVRGITGLRRDPGHAVRQAQIAGRALPDPSTWDQRVTSRLHWIPAWGDYSLSQLTANGYEIRKRTGQGHTWIRSDGGQRAAGLGYVGTPSGGLAFGMRNFWQLHPTELEITGAAGDDAETTVWMWSPRAEAMDLRFYHDGMGQDTYPEQLDALEITYEDYEPGFGTPYGVGRTTELMFWALAATPDAARFAELAAATAAPPLLASSPEHNHEAGVFGSWAPVDRSTPAKAQIEDRLEAIHRYHREQVEQRSWYGFWDYGDVMHSYDRDRHQWRYDVGGYAWDNSELSPDLWLWYHYLRTGDATAFRFAEAMTRHTSEVDQYHLGQWKGLGTRHGVLHWADSAKQVRISNANYRRFYYFLTGDERTGDILHELIDSDRTYLVLNATRKIDGSTGPYDPDPAALPMSKTTDWSAVAGAWLTEWERGGDPRARERLLASARSIAALPNGWAQAGGTYNLRTARFNPETEPTVSVGSLSSVFGLIEVMTEFLELVDEPEVEAKWVQFCRLYNSPREDQIAETGFSWGNQNLRQAYSRATAYAAHKLDDDALGARAWQELRTGHAGYPDDHEWASRRVEPPFVLRAIDEADFSSNASSQYGLAAVQCLALVGEHL